MKDRAPRVANVLAGAVLLLVAAGAILLVASWPAPLSYPEWGFPGFQGVGALVFLAVGWPIARRQPGNPIGWLMLVAALLSAIQLLAHYYAVVALVTAPASLPAGEWATWLEQWVWVPLLALAAAFVLLLFPNGTLPSRRWWIVVAGVALGTVLAAVGFAFQPGVMTSGLPVPNPMAPTGESTITVPLFSAGLILMYGGMLAAAGSLVVRFRAGRPVERQQVKWLILASLIVGANFLAYFVLFAVEGFLFRDIAGGWPEAITALSLLTIPAAIGIAVLRYRLYDIDFIIRRTLVYGALTLTLALSYLGSVLVLSQVLGGLAGGAQLAVAGSTLTAAALARPIRGRLQDAVDRRFYRARYDAEHTLEAFGQRLRDEVDLDSLTDDLQLVVNEAMAPASVSVWIRRP